MNKKIYFASDFHLGIDAGNTSKAREKLICDWLDQIKIDAEAIYLLGDLFDFWFEYKTVIPKGNVRFLGKLAELTDSGILIYFFTGNHDMWIFDYFKKELNIITYHKPLEIELKGKKFFIGHGDGLGKGDYMFKFIKKFFDSKLCQWLFHRLHPNFGLGIGYLWSNHSRNSHKDEFKFLGKEKEWLIDFCEDKSSSSSIDFFVFGHRHLAIDYLLENNQSRYINLGEWMYQCSYGVFDGDNFELKTFKKDKNLTISSNHLE